MVRLVNTSTREAQSLDLALGKMGFVILGRQPMHDIMNEGHISRFHATIIRDATGHYLVDHSLGGTWYRRQGHQGDSVMLHTILHVVKSQPAEDWGAGPAAEAQKYAFDRTTYTSYLDSLSKFLKLLDDEEQRKNLVSLGVRLEDRMLLELGIHENSYRFETEAAGDMK